MEVTINNQNYLLKEACSIEQMLTVVLPSGADGIAIAANQTIIPKSDWPSHALNPGDQIIIIKATQGG